MKCSVVGLLLAVVACVPLCGCGGKEETKTTKPTKPTGPAAPKDEVPSKSAATPQQAVAKGIAYMRKSQLTDGGWPMADAADKSHLGVTTVAAHGLLTAGVPGSDPMIQKATAYIAGFAKDDGGIYDEGFRNYTTSIAMMVLLKVGDEKYKPTTDKALAFLKTLQWDQGEGLQPESPDFGGAGYGAHQRPDLSNTAWFVEAIRKAGLEPDDPAVQNALIFVSRTQEGEGAKGYWISVGEGGFIYSPHGGGESKVPEVTLPSGEKGLKAYGSMSYAGFLSLIYAGLDRNDPRVQAALGWVRKHWTLEVNPELGKQGYYYYLMTVGKAMRAYGDKEIVDDRGVSHDWQKELADKLISLQQADGSWVNKDEERWFEGNPALATPFALVGLDACQAKL